MRELQIWICGFCAEDRTWGARESGRNPELRCTRAQLNCRHCGMVTAHTFTGQHRMVEVIYYHESRRKPPAPEFLPAAERSNRRA